MMDIMLKPRYCEILISETLPKLPENALIIGENGILPFQTQNLLGQEFSLILFDARQGFHLEALAIAAGTIKAGGTLIILLFDWRDLEQKTDLDSLRWSDLGEVATPNFIHHFKSCVKKAAFPILDAKSAVCFSEVLPASSPISTSPIATAQQQYIIQNILQNKAECYLLTAKRGRGKSALAGLLANQIKAKIYLTAANKNAANILMQYSQREIEFIAPDELAEKLTKQPSLFQQDWLFVDEAAMLPLSWLVQFSQHFQHILFITTLHSYEGTGRGFELKFKQKIDRTLACFELEKPLRWAEQDRLEQFIEDLLLLNVEAHLRPPQFSESVNVQLDNLSQKEVANAPQEFYGLLSLAHYRTTPTDLRRLFDGKNQQFYCATVERKLIGGVWAMKEGEMTDLALIEQIQRGQRRPRGNLVPQLLCFHGNLPQACQLHSLRISRIALLAQWQQKGIGSQFIEWIKRQSAVDFLSVSFGYTSELAAFWQKNGFHLSYLGEHFEATSGCYTAVGLLGLSEMGKSFVTQATTQFYRDISLSSHPLKTQFTTGEIDWQLDKQDWLSLKNFAEFNRTLSVTVPAIRRLLHQFGSQKFPLAAQYCETQQLPVPRKNSLKLLREEMKMGLSFL